MTFDFLFLLSLFLLTAQSKTTTTTLAIIGDFGVDNTNEGAVASLIRRWDDAARLDGVLTVGDNNYPNGAQSTVEANVGKYYSYFMYPYKSYKTPPLYKGAPDTINRFYPATGNHDWGDGLKNYLDYYAGIKTADGTPQYFYVRNFNTMVDVFFLDSMNNMPAQGTWLQTRLSQSKAPWKIVLVHHPPYSSGQHGNTASTQLPYWAWGAHVVISGHDHNYERIFKRQGTCPAFPYIVNGLGGVGIRAISRTEPGSVFKYTQKYGAQLVTATPTQIKLEFITTDNVVQDSLILTKDASDPCGFSTFKSFDPNTALPPPPPARKLAMPPPRRSISPPQQQQEWPNWPRGPSWPNYPRWPNWPAARSAPR